MILKEMDMKSSNIKNIGEMKSLRKMSHKNKICLEKLTRLKQKYLKDVNDFELTKHRMTMDQLLVNILVLSLEKRVYFEQEMYSKEAENDEVYGNEEDEEMILDYKMQNADLNQDADKFFFEESEYFGIKNYNSFFEPIICNSNKSMSKDIGLDVDWSMIISEAEDKHDQPYDLFNNAGGTNVKTKNKYRPFVCEKSGCTKRYTSLYGLKYHEKNGHNKVYDHSKPFMCPVPGCGKRYKNLNGLRYHQEHGHLQ